MRAAWVLAGLFMVVAAANAQVTLPSIFSDHMVLQRDAAIPVWGHANPGQSVRVEIGLQRQSITADDDGAWRVEFAPMPASREPMSLHVASDDGSNLTLSDVLIGDVWICAGQSNMQMGLAKSDNGDAVVKAADHPDIRLFNVPNRLVEPGDDFDAQWAACSPESAEKFSAVGYYFGRSLRERLDVPIGLIGISWGATRGEAWTPRATLEASQIFRDGLTISPERQAARDRMRAEYDAKVADWKLAAKKAKDAGEPLPRMPNMPQGLRPENQPAACFEGLVRPVLPYAVKGVIWYQGESDLGSADRYEALLPLLIAGWRDAWHAPTLPFGIVQLPNKNPPASEPADGSWPRLREAQRLTNRQVEHTGLVVTIDVGDANDGHPKNKRDVGLRLARWAMVDVYGNPGPAGGPLFKSVEIDGSQVVVRFADIGAGLRTAAASEPLRGFALAGSDQIWHWADATVVDGTVELSSPDVPHPVAVRYAWADNPENANLTNDTGLPASPFRTDDWPLKTATPAVE